MQLYSLFSILSVLLFIKAKEKTGERETPMATKDFFEKIVESHEENPTTEEEKKEKEKKEEKEKEKEKEGDGTKK